MKVTQIVKQAIETRINEIAKPKLEPLVTQKENLNKESNEQLSKIKQELRKALNVAITNILANTLKKYPELTISKNRYYNNLITLTKPSEIAKDIVDNEICLGFIHYKENEHDSVDKQINDLNEKIKKVINDTILELELGNNKATLEDLLKKIKF